MSNQMRGPYDPELYVGSKDRIPVTNGRYPFSAIGQFESGCTGMSAIGLLHTFRHWTCTPVQILDCANCSVRMQLCKYTLVKKNHLSCQKSRHGVKAQMTKFLYQNHRLASY